MSRFYLDEFTTDRNVYEVGAGRALVLLEPAHGNKEPGDA